MEALDEMIDEAGPDRASYLLERLMERAANLGVQVPLRWNTPYINTIPPEEEVAYPGDRAIERQDQEPGPLERHRHGGARQQVRRQYRRPPGDLRVAGDHARGRLQPLLPRLLSGTRRDASCRAISCTSRVTLRRVSTARAFLEGRLSEKHLENFRHELRDHPGLSSYPHPWLMPDFWQFPTVSMGLGPIAAIYQARFMRYLENRGIIPASPAARCGRSWATANATSPNRWARITLGVAREAGQPDLRGQLQPAAPGRSGARQRPHHSGAGSGVPGRRMERDQGGLGRGLGRSSGARFQRPADQAHARMRGRRISDLPRERRGVSAQGIFRQVSRAAQAGRAHERRRALESAPRRARSRSRCSTPTGAP